MKAYILMADVIGSSDRDPNKLMSSFRSVVEDMNQRFGNKLLSPLTITLGDEFQGVVDSLMTGIEIIFAIDKGVLTSRQPYRLRFVLVYGEIETPLNRDVAHGMLGKGLTRARKMLENMKKSDREVLLEGLGETRQEKMMLAFELYRAFYNDWPEKDRQTAYDLLEVGDYKKVASMHDRDNSSMWRKERSLKIREYNASKELINMLTND